MGGGFEKAWKKYSPAGIVYEKTIGKKDKSSAVAAAQAQDPNYTPRQSLMSGLTNEDGSLKFTRDQLFQY